LLGNARNLKREILMADQTPKAKGVADIVFLMDATGSMGPCIDALKANIETFIDTLTTASPNVPSPVHDWRGRVVGFRDAEEDGAEWFIDNPFVRDASALKSQLHALVAEGGGDAPESLLDAIYKVATVGQTAKGAASEDPHKWRYRSSAARVVVIFSDAPYKPTMAIPEAVGGGLDDITNVCTSNRIILSIFAPSDPGYDALSAIDKSEYEPLGGSGLDEITSDPNSFEETLKQLAASVSKSAETPEL
jgi:hypothetical protein